MDKKKWHSVKFLFAAGIIAQGAAAGKNVLAAAETDLNETAAAQENLELTDQTEIQAEDRDFFIDSAKEFCDAVNSQKTELNETFFLNINTALAPDVQTILQNMDTGMTACSWKFQKSNGGSDGKNDNDYTLFMFEAEYRDDIKVLQAFHNNGLCSKLSASEAAMMEKAKDIVGNIISPDMNEYDKALAVHDYIIKNGRYETAAEDADVQKSLFKTEGILMNGMGVCSSYAGAMNLLLGMADMECVFVTGVAQNKDGIAELHAWNKVNIGGMWYNIDAAWDDPDSDKLGDVSYSYFAVTDETLSADHSWNRDAFPQSAVSTYYNYFNYNGVVADNYADFKEIVKQCVKQSVDQTASGQKDSGDVLVRLYVQNYDAKKYNVNFIFDLLPSATTCVHSKIAGTSGEFVIKIN